MVTLKSLIINIRLANYAKKLKTYKINVDRNIKVPDLILSTLLLSKADIGLKCFSPK